MRRYGGLIAGALGLAVVVLAVACGLAVDIGRLYIAKSELEVFADSAALAAALRLNGDATAILRARADVEAMRSVDGSPLLTRESITVEFAAPTGDGPPLAWTASPLGTARLRFARVTVQASVPLFVLPVVSGREIRQVMVTAVAGRAAGPGPDALFPFAPVALRQTPPDFGFVPGQLYSLLRPDIDAKPVCAGDRATGTGTDRRGYFGPTARPAALFRDVSEDRSAPVPRRGDRLPLTVLPVETLSKALAVRLQKDRRVVTVPVTDPVEAGQVLGFGRFLLVPEGLVGGALCAAYQGPAPSESSFTAARLWKR